MPTTTQPSAQTAFILDKIEDLRSDLSSLRNAIDCLTTGYNDFKLLYTKAHEQLRADVNAVNSKVQDHDERLKVLEELVKPMVFQSRVVTFVGSALLVTIMGFFWAVFTHQITLVIP